MLTPAVGCFVAAVVLTPLVRAIAVRAGFVDRPGGHKQHGRVVALGGGVAILLAIAGPAVIAYALLAHWASDTPPDWLPAALLEHLPGLASRGPQLAAVLAGALVLHVVGLIDDVRPLGPVPKFIAQFAVAGFIAGPMGLRVVELLPVPLSIAATVAWMVVIINAFNFLDNMDGLSAGVAAVAGAILAVASLASGQLFVPALAAAVVGGVAGYLVFNFHPARIFMGDAGSLVIGYLLAVLTILATYYDPDRRLSPFGLLVPVVVLAVPLYDVGSVVIHRLRLGISPFRGDRRHFSHRLVRRGLTVRGAVLTIYLATAATGLPAIVLPRVSWPYAVLLLGQCLCVVAIIAILEHAGPSAVEGASTNPDDSRHNPPKP